MNPIVSVEGLGKRYRLGSPRPLLARLRNGLWGPQPGQAPNRRAEFWALREANFNVHPGEVVGIIGRNGAGKSTLLKILARIVAPTTGRAVLQGRVGCLLEVGTGFHPDLSGRENIYLSGALLGMRRAEIHRVFDDIVAFAEIERFLDTPVKRYSSGMYVRLGFAVAAHLEPEILIVDEVLAVGDLAFQRKSLARMREVARNGRTVLFVSHSMSAISTLTHRALLLEQGRIVADGPTAEVVSRYLAGAYVPHAEWRAAQENAAPMQILRVAAGQDGRIGATELNAADDVEFTVEYAVRQPVRGAVVALVVHAGDGVLLFSTEDTDTAPELLDERMPGRYVCRVRIPGGWLNQRQYFVRASCGVPAAAVYDNVEALGFMLVHRGDHITRGHRAAAYLLPTLTWMTELRRATAELAGVVP